MSYLFPEDGTTEIYFQDDGRNNSYSNEKGVQYTLKKYKSNKMMHSKFWLISRKNIKYKIYISKVFGNKYGYGKKSMDLLVIKFGNEQLKITTYKNGWLYYNILFIRHIYNKLT